MTELTFQDTNERPYECNVCHKRFSRSDVLHRHAKNHGDGASKVKAKDAVANRQPSAASGVSPMNMGPGAENGSHLLPPIGSLTTPREMALPVTGTPLDFLANVSAQHVRADPNIHPMLLDEQQPYFGWNEVAPADQPGQHNVPAFESTSNDMLQMWLEPRTDVGSNSGSLDLGHFPLMTPDQQTRTSVDSGRSGVDNIPSERFSRVQRCWLAPNHTGRLINSLWKDIVQTSGDNIFSRDYLHLPNDPNLLQGSRYGIDDDCRGRLQAAFAQVPSNFSHLQSPRNDNGSPATFDKFFPNMHFPPAEVMDMALDLYFRTFHPLAPCVHLPTFEAKNTHLPYLYVMILIGMLMLGTKGTTGFVLKNFTHVMEKITAELSKCSMGVETPSNVVSIFGTAFLFLNLAVLTGVSGASFQTTYFSTNYSTGDISFRAMSDALCKPDVGE